MEKTSPQPSTSPQPTAAPPPPQPSPQPPPSSSSSSTPSASEPPPPPSSSSSSPSLQPPPNPQTPAPPISHHQPQLFQLQQRPPLPRARPQPPYPPFSHPLTSQPPASAAASPLPTARGGVAMGVPAHHHARPSQPPVSLSPFGGPSQAFNQQFSPLARNPGGTPEQSSVSNPQVRQPVPGVHSIGMFASLSSGSQIRPSGMPTQHQQRPSHPIMRTSSPSINQSSSSQNQQKFHTSGLSRGGPSMASPSSQSPVPQSSQPLQQHLTSAQGKQIHTAPLSSSSLRPQMKSQALPQRPLHLQPHNQTLMATSHQQQTPSSQPQQVQQQHASQSQEHHSQQYSQLRSQQPLSQQQQAARAHGSASQRSIVPPSVQSGGVHPGATNPMGSADDGESSNQILGKRSIRELVTQIDPFEKLDPEVEDVLVEIADDFIESITTFACSLAKHRKSTTLEAKDILLHVERNWNMTLPGFGGDEIKCYKKQSTNDIHKERLAAVKKSMSGTSDSSNVKNPPSGQAPLSGKSHAAKMPTSASQAERAS